MKRLYIIGNGFDLFFDLPTTTDDFCKELDKIIVKDNDNSPKKIAACQYMDQRIRELDANDVELISENLKIQEKLMFGRAEIIKTGDELYYKSRL